MNAERLLQLYDRVSEAPDAIPRLRRFVLDLAVRGKLVEQSPDDPRAECLLPRIAGERDSASKAGRTRITKSLSQIIEGPHHLPPSWVWIPLGETGAICTGTSINARLREELESSPSGIPFIATKDVGHGLCPIAYDNGLCVPEPVAGFRIAPSGTVLICAEGGSAGKKIGITDRTICFGNKLLANVTWSVIAPRFVLFVYMSGYFYEQFVARMTGVIGGISIRKFLELPFPLPPVPEQHRIVAKVDELMALCDSLEAERDKREVARDCLTTASLSALTAPDVDEKQFKSRADFAIKVLPELTNRPDQIKVLRQTILDLAVRGKLVEQDPGDVPVVFSRGAPSSNSGTDVRQTKISSRPATFEIPEGWVWLRLEDILEVGRAISYGVIKLGEEPRSGGISVLRCSDVRPGYVDLSEVRNVSEEIESKYLRTRLVGGEILINIRGTLGGVALVEKKLAGFNIAREVAMVPVAAELCGPFLVYVMLSPFFWAAIQRNLRGIAYKGLNLAILRNLEIPLPPIAEQNRIVARLDEFMAHCDQLEQELHSGQATRNRLLELLIFSALGSLTMEAA